MSEESFGPLSEYFLEEVEEREELGVTPLEVLDESKFLDDPQGRVLLDAYKHGETTLAELASIVDRPEPEVKRYVDDLRLQGYLGTEYRSGERYYYVRDSWETEEFPSGPIIPLVYQYNLLSDEERLGTIKAAIDDLVEPGDVVADLGAGVGALSYLAARRAETVYAVEMDREVYEKGREIMATEGMDNVEYIRADAREVDLPEPVDVVMCEMLDTALVAELQVPVMNYAVDELAGEDATLIPREARTSARLVRSDYEFYGGSFRLPHFEEYDSRESETYSDRTVYHHVDFTEHNSKLVEARVTMTATRPGTVNGVQLNTDVRFGEGSEFLGATPWLNAPLNLPFDEDVAVETGQEVTVELSYELGGGLNNILYEVVDIS